MPKSNSPDDVRPTGPQRLLGGFYALSSVLAGILMVATGALVLASALARVFGWVVPDANALAGYCFVSTIFLALAPTLRTGGHIRVSLITSRLPGKIRRWQELWCLLVTLSLVTYLAYWLVNLTLTSWRFGDVSQGILSIPLWIPQTAMSLGAIAMVIALLDNLVRVATGKIPDYERLMETVDDIADR